MAEKGQFGADTCLEPVDLDLLPEFGSRPILAARRAFHLSCVAIASSLPELRPARSPPLAWKSFYVAAAQKLPSDEAEAQRFFRSWFQPFLVRVPEGAFFTGYYEPELCGRQERSSGFTEPIFGRPNDLVTFSPGDFPLGPNFSAGRREKHGGLTPYPTRKEIESSDWESGSAIVWVKDAVDAFKIHLQGSARIRLGDGGLLRLTYAGRNGRSYTSVGKKLVAEGHISQHNMSPEQVYAWVRSRGLGLGELGREMLQANDSYIFFELNDFLRVDQGPIGAASIPLTPLGSMAVDRSVWPYGLPYWVSGAWKDNAGHPFGALLIGQDTGSAIVGAARADIFYGGGETAGSRAGEVRHHGSLYVLLPNLARVDAA